MKWCRHNDGPKELWKRCRWKIFCGRCFNTHTTGCSPWSTLIASAMVAKSKNIYPYPILARDWINVLVSMRGHDNEISVWYLGPFLIITRLVALATVPPVWIGYLCCTNNFTHLRSWKLDTRWVSNWMQWECREASKLLQIVALQISGIYF